PIRCMRGTGPSSWMIAWPAALWPVTMRRVGARLVLVPSFLVSRRLEEQPAAFELVLGARLVLERGPCAGARQGPLEVCGKRGEGVGLEPGSGDAEPDPREIGIENRPAFLEAPVLPPEPLFERSQLEL